MTKTQKVINIIEAIILVAVAFVLISVPEIGYGIVVLVLGIGFVIKGVSALWNYFTLSVHMVGARRSFYYGIMIFDLGLFTICLGNLPKLYVMLYLCGLYLFSGGIDIWSAISQKKMESKHYKMKLLQGIINILIGIMCLVFLKSEEMVILIYAAGLAYNGIVRLINVFKKNETVYIQ